MERVTETKLSLEALRQMKSHGRTASPTLIGAIEQIVNRAIETHLDEPFYSEAAPFLDYLGNRMSLTCEQALVFALFMEQSTDNRIQISDFARMVGCRTVRVISMMAAADELVRRRLIRRVRKEDCLFYSVPMAVVTAVKEDRLYEPEPIDHLTSEQLFDRMGRIFDEAEEDNSHLLEDLDELVGANQQLSFCQQTRAYDLNKVERLLFYVFCHRFVNLDDDLIGSHNWLEYFNRRVAFGLKSQLNADRLSLQTQGVIEPCNEEEMGDRRYYHLTARAKELLFGDLCLVEQQAKRPNDLLESATLAPRELFYNPSVERQVDRLSELLSPEHFTGIQQRLEAGGLRKGLACLFYGAPGTGKTETVYQLARRTGRNLMVVDVAQIKSCWVGESEKNIRKAFERYRAYVKEAERAPILLFNEADAVLGIRQEGASRAVEKMENSLQNIILQEMEQLDGIMIATTNLTQNLDRAFERRFLYKIEFERPDAAVKSRIWRSMIPTLDERTAATLAERYDFSGGQIENIARKRTVEMILRGVEPTMEELDEFCRDEQLGNREKRRRIGF